jgi:hypothetical protein
VDALLIAAMQNPFAVGGLGAIIGAAMAARAKSQRRRLRRALIHLRMEAAWKNARIRMYLVGPIGASRSSTKYSIPPEERINASTNQEFLRYIGG